MVVKILNFLWLAWAWVPPLCAVVFHEIDTSQALECVFSSSHQNRIVVDGGIVKKIIYPAGQFSFRMENESGQAFIYPMGNFSDSVTISVVTGNLFVQDLEVRAEDKSSEVVILQEPIAVEESLGAIGTISSDVADEVVSRIKTVRKGAVPAGYVERDRKRSAPRNDPDFRFVADPIVVLEGPFEMVYSFEVRSQSSTTLHLSEEELKKPGDRWVFIEKSILEPKEKTLAIIGVKK